MYEAIPAFAANAATEEPAFPAVAAVTFLNPCSRAFVIAAADFLSLKSAGGISGFIFYEKTLEIKSGRGFL